MFRQTYLDETGQVLTYNPIRRPVVVDPALQEIWGASQERVESSKRTIHWAMLPGLERIIAA
jgi:hypothetical protein